MDTEEFERSEFVARFSLPTDSADLKQAGLVEYPAGWSVKIGSIESPAEGETPPGPEGRYVTAARIAPIQAHVLGEEGWAYHLHSPRPYRARFTTRVPLDAREYELSLTFHADWRYDFGGETMPPDQPDHAAVRFIFGRRETAWTTPDHLRGNQLTHVVTIDEPASMRLGFEIVSRYPATSNGLYLQSFTVKGLSGLESMSQHRVIVNLLPQDATLNEKWHVLFKTHESRQGILQSHDDALTLVPQGRHDSYIRLWGRDRMGAGQLAAIDAAGVGVQDMPLTGISLQPLPEGGLESMPEMVINLLPQDATLLQKWHVMQAVHNAKQSLMQSHDDAYTLLTLAGAGGMARLWGGASFLPEQTGQLQAIGVAFVPESFPSPRPPAAPPDPAGAFRFTHWPSTGTTIWQPFGVNPERYKKFGFPGHEGIDIDAPFGSPLFAVADGTVSTNPPGTEAYGIHVRINHSDGYQTVYAHMKEAAVQEGQAVRGGDLIGFADSTGNVWPEPTKENPHAGTHLHLTLKNFNRETEYPRHTTDPTPFLSQLPQYPGQAPSPPPAPSRAPTFDLLDYMCGDGRLYEVGGSGGQERFQTQREGDRFYIVKNSNWEELWADADYIWRGFDTSPDNDRYYIQREPGREGARWINRHMRVGETFHGFGHHVQYFKKRDCSHSEQFSGPATNQTTLAAHHAAMTWNNITIRDVIELAGIGGERYFFARGFGLVAWSSRWGDSAVTEVHATGARPPNVRLRIPCMRRD